MSKKILAIGLVLVVLFSLFAAFPANATSNIQVGAWIGAWPTAQNISDFQTLQGKHLDIVHAYINFDQPFTWYTANADAVYNNSSTLMLTWQPFGVTTADINNGAQDTVITQMARDLKAYGKTILLRPMHEFNGNWYPWAIGYYDDPSTGVHKTGTYPNTNATYSNAFKRIVDTFRREGATNVKFIYNVSSSNSGPNTSYLGPYPGDTYVDYISIDAYNWGTAVSWSAWMSLDAIITQAYTELKVKNKPMMLAEWASTEIGGNKAQWITDAFNVLKSSGKYDLIQSAIWFNENKETDWRINSSTNSLNAYKQAISTLTSTASSTPYFMIVNRNSGKCLDLIGGDTSNGARINQWAYDYNGPNQRWAVLPTGDGHFKFISYVSGKSMSVVYGSMENEAQIHDWDYSGNPDQKWDFIDAGNGWYKIRNVNSGKMLDVAWASLDNDAKVQQNADNGHPAEQWRLQPWGDYNIKTTYGKYVCVENMGSTNGYRIIQYDYENNPWFKWRFENVGDGWYKVSSLNAITRCIDVKDVSTAPAAITHLWDYVGGDNQKVRIMPKTNGTFQFFFKHDGMAWDIPSGQTGNNVTLTQYPYNGWPNQEFTLERVP